MLPAQGGGARDAGGMATIKESSINVVITNRPKMLRGLNQKVRSRMTLFILGSHGHKDCRRTDGA